MVQAPVAHTFDVFVHRDRCVVAEAVFSARGEQVRDVSLEPQLGGRVFEVWDDGTTTVWGEITAWEPPRRLVLSWQCTPSRTEVEIRFRALGSQLTRVELEHRGWEALTEDQLTEDCALPGGYRSGAYSEGEGDPGGACDRCRDRGTGALKCGPDGPQQRR